VLSASDSFILVGEKAEGFILEHVGYGVLPNINHHTSIVQPTLHDSRLLHTRNISNIDYAIDIRTLEFSGWFISIRFWTWFIFLGSLIAASFLPGLIAGFILVSLYISGVRPVSRRSGTIKYMPHLVAQLVVNHYGTKDTRVIHQQMLRLFPQFPLSDTDSDALLGSSEVAAYLSGLGVFQLNQQPEGRLLVRVL
jgi:hypothetical protein